jgi:crotonobetainyl-CoA:carnitine CoA-transferase CaiB-like acyl-CoA transferase
MHFLGPALLHYIANDHVESGSGNRDRHCAPHGVYPCAGEDSWIAIACTTDEQWRALSALIDGSEKRDARNSATHDWTSVRVSQDFLASQKGRKPWTLSTGSLVTGRGPIDAFELEPILQSHGIPASKAATSEDMSYDPQLAWRKHFVDVEDSKLGKVVVERSSYIPSDTPGKIARSARAPGDDTTYVLENLLGYRRARIEELKARSVLQ